MITIENKTDVFLGDQEANLFLPKHKKLSLITKIGCYTIPRICEEIKSGGSDDNRKFEQNLFNQFTSFFTQECKFFFSHQLDVTRSIQSQYEFLNHFKTSSDFRKSKIGFWQTVDDRFFWNKNLHSPFISLNLHPWILPIVEGFAHSSNCILSSTTSPVNSPVYQTAQTSGAVSNASPPPRSPSSPRMFSSSQENVPTAYSSKKRQEKSFQYIIISRRGNARSGARFESRGVDHNGDVSNFVETEQILIRDHRTTSFCTNKRIYSCDLSPKNVFGSRG